MSLFPFLLILIIGALTSYTDITKRKIKNIHIVVGGMLGLIYYIILFVFDKFSPDYSFFSNLGIAFAISFVLYLFRIWPAGDAKLFMLLAFLFSRPSQLNLYPSLFLFFNISIIGALLIILDLIFGKFLPSPIDSLKIILSKKNLISFGELLIIAFSVTWTRPFLMGIIPLSSNIAVILILYSSYGFIYGWIKKLKKKLLPLTLIFLAGIFLRFLLQKEIFLNFSYFILTFKHTFIFIVFYFVFFETKEEFLTKKVGLDKIRKGTKVADDIYDKENKLVIKKGKILTSGKLDKIKKLFKDKKINFSSIPVKKTISFAPIIFLGTIISYTNFLSLFSKIINQQ